jgi:hypothetical protein
VEGLYDRIRYDRAVGAGRAAALYIAVRAMLTLSGLFPSDMQYFVFRAAVSS